MSTFIESTCHPDIFSDQFHTLSLDLIQGIKLSQFPEILNFLFQCFDLINFPPPRFNKPVPKHGGVPCSA